MIGKINSPDTVADIPTCYTQILFSGYAMFWTGFSVGLSNLICGYSLILKFFFFFKLELLLESLDQVVL